MKPLETIPSVDTETTFSETAFLTAREAAQHYGVSLWTVIKAARGANIRTGYCRQRLRRVYESGPKLLNAIEQYVQMESEKTDSCQNPANQALDYLLAALRG